MKLRPLSLLALILVLAAITGCGSDDDPPPTTPPPPPGEQGLRVPEDYPTIVDALAVAFAGPERAVSLAAGDYTVDASLDEPVTLRCRPGQVGQVRLVDSRLVVRAHADTVALHGLVLAGGDTLLTVLGAATVTLDSCRIQDAVLGIQHTGGGGLAVTDSRIHHCSGGGAIHAHGAASFGLHNTTIEQCTAGESGVAQVTGATVLDWTDVRLDVCTGDQAVLNLEDTAGGTIDGLIATFCPPYTVRHRGGALTLRDAWFEFQSGTSVAVGLGSRLTLEECRFLQCVWPVLEVGGVADMGSCVVYDGAGPAAAWLVGDGGELTAARCTVHQGAGPLVDAGQGASVDLDDLLATDLTTPMAAGSLAGLTMDGCDLWLASGADAWEGLTAVRDAGAGNLELDPEYCDPDHGDLRLQITTPVPGLGALPVGCGDS